ncbi:Ig-like domain-containing protein [Pseudomonas sp. LB3P93]
MSAAEITLHKPSVDEAPEGVLDPEALPDKGATVRIRPYENMAFRDHVYLYVGNHYVDDIPIGANAVGKDVVFTVAAEEFVADSENRVQIRYEVQFYQGTREESLTLDLKLKGNFESDAGLDLSAENYVVSVEKPPETTPVFARTTRAANWGAAPYRYTSEHPTIASVHEHSGEVTALRNGECMITATDSQHQARSYKLTIKGITELTWLSPAADWEGMAHVCAAAKLQPVTLAQIRRLWNLYQWSGGTVAAYLEWLIYPVWTADVLGAGTAYAYDLSGSNDHDNAQGHDTTLHMQIVGASQA